MMTALRDWLGRVSFRGRIALWYAVAIPALVFALALAAQAVLVAALQTTLDQSLKERVELAGQAVLTSARVGPGEYEFIVDRLAAEELPAIPLLLRIADPFGRTLASFGEVPEAIVPSLNRSLYDDFEKGGQFETLMLSGDNQLRVYTAPIRDPSNERVLVLVQSADSLSHIAAARSRLWWYTAGIGSLGSVATTLIGLVILRRGFRPLDRILSRVHEVETTDLASGLPNEPRPPELQQLAESLNSMWRRLDATFTTRQQFVASVSHDLRTPLTILRGQVDVLLLDPNLDPEVKQSLERMRSEAARLIRMTNNLLVDAQLEASPRLSPTPVNLRELLEDVVLEMRVLASAAGINLELASRIDVVIHGDYDLLKQAVLNVVDNAVKYTPRGGTVEVRLSVDAGVAVVETSDNGPGIPPEHLSRLGEPFYRPPRNGEANDGSVGGAGLGLAIAIGVMELHGGRLEVKSGESTGTTVIFRLPLMVAMMPNAPAP